MPPAPSSHWHLTLVLWATPYQASPSAARTSPLAVSVVIDYWGLDDGAEGRPLYSSPLPCREPMTAVGRRVTDWSYPA